MTLLGRVSGRGWVALLGVRLLGQRHTGRWCRRCRRSSRTPRLPRTRCCHANRWYTTFFRWTATTQVIGVSVLGNSLFRSRTGVGACWVARTVPMPGKSNRTSTGYCDAPRQQYTGLGCDVTCNRVSLSMGSQRVCEYVNGRSNLLLQNRKVCIPGSSRIREQDCPFATATWK